MRETDISRDIASTAEPRPSPATESATTDETNRTAMRRFDIAATIFFWIATVAALLHLFLRLYPLSDPASGTGVLQVDFVVFWVAAKLAAAGQPLAIFDPDTLLAAARLGEGFQPKNFLWLYPAGYLLALFPLGMLSFTSAYLTYMAVSAIAFVLAIRAPASVLPGLWRVMLASPMVVIGCLFLGQTSVLWTAGLVAGLWAMRGGKPAAAGLAIALLTMKPQLGLLIPVALIAARQWAVMGWATGFTLLLAGAATAMTGPGYWVLFLGALDDAFVRIADGTTHIHLMSSFYAFIRALGMEHGSALIAQYVLTAGLIAVIGWIWSRPGLGNDLKFATLCAAIPMATPYAFYYETTLAMAAALFLIRDGFGRHLAGKTWLLVIWFGPAPALLLPELLNISLYTPPILLVTLAICLARVRWRLSSAGGGKPAERPCPAPS